PGGKDTAETISGKVDEHFQHRGNEQQREDQRARQQMSEHRAGGLWGREILRINSSLSELFLKAIDPGDEFCYSLRRARSQHCVTFDESLSQLQLLGKARVGIFISF